MSPAIYAKLVKLVPFAARETLRNRQRESPARREIYKVARSDRNDDTTPVEEESVTRMRETFQPRGYFSTFTPRFATGEAPLTRPVASVDGRLYLDVALRTAGRGSGR